MTKVELESAARHFAHHSLGLLLPKQKALQDPLRKFCYATKEQLNFLTRYLVTGMGSQCRPREFEQGIVVMGRPHLQDPIVNHVKIKSGEKFPFKDGAETMKTYFFIKHHGISILMSKIQYLLQQAFAFMS